jgi:hypothetical protein
VKTVVDQVGWQVVEDMHEQGRQELAKKFGPTILASLAGAGAPPAGPLSLLATDAEWQQSFDAVGSDADAERSSPNVFPVGLRMFVKGPPHRPYPKAND